MELVVSSLGTALYVQHRHKGYLIKWSLIGPLCKRWSRNREPDEHRVSEMVKYHLAGGYLPSTIHLAELPEGLICYDGNHRRIVFDRLEDRELICIVDIIFDSNTREVIEAFNAINRSVPLPELYLNDDTENPKVKDDLLKLVQSYEKRYKSFISTSSRCRAPQFNRDTLLDNLYTIHQQLGPELTIDRLESLLIELNTKYSEERLCQPHTEYPPSVIAKCKKHNLWLFLNRTISIDHLRTLLK